MAIIPPFFMDAVVALGVEKSDGTKHWIGTGFLVGRKEADNPSKFTIYVITNKHVVKNQRMLYVRFSNDSTVGVTDLPMKLLDKDGTVHFSAHPSLEVDVVAIQIIPKVIVDKDLSLSYFQLDSHALTLSQMQSTGVDEGSLVYALGFPMNLVSDSVKAPICRLGCISRVADAFLAPQEATTFLVDAQAFPGNSGGPIVSRPEHISIEDTPKNTNANLIGILSAFIPYQEVLISQQTGRQRMIQEENSGLTIVHPVDRITEVVELEWARVETHLKSRGAVRLQLPVESNEPALV